MHNLADKNWGICRTREARLHSNTRLNISISEPCP
jgi:hypothetical protein